MPKTKTAASAVKDAVVEAGKPAPPTRLLQSRDVKPERDAPDLTPPERGPMTGESSMSDADFVRAYGTVDELRSFRAAIDARRAREGTVAWRQLPSGFKIPTSQVFAVCTKCRKGFWVRQAAGACQCNPGHLVYGGHLRPGTKTEEAEWFRREEEAARRRAADEPRRKAELAEYNKRAAERLPRDRQGRIL